MKEEISEEEKNTYSVNNFKSQVQKFQVFTFKQFKKSEYLFKPKFSFVRVE